MHLRRPGSAAILVLLGILAHGGLAPAAEAAPHPRAALVIGNAGYNFVHPLKNPTADAQDMCKALGELGYQTACFTDLKDPREFKARLQDFVGALKPKSEVLFYYAGHAVQVRGENYLIPVSAKLRSEADVARETVSLNYIMAQLLQAKHYLNIVILDACRSNPWGDNPHGITAGLAPITAIPRGTMVLYATAANDVSEDGEGRNGVLTKHLLANIKLPGLTVDEVFKRVSEGVQADSAEAAGHTQTPALYTNFTGEFCFTGCIDKVARAELERLRKENAEQLEEARRERAELEARNRLAEARLAASMTSTNCDKAVLSDSSQCFNAPRERTVRAVAAALIEQGFTITDSDVVADVRGTQTKENPQNNKLTDIRTITANVREVPITHHTVLTLAVNDKSVLHDEYHTWGQVLIIPVPTSKQYRDVVKKDVDSIDPKLFHDIFTSVERTLREENSDAVVLQADAAASGDHTLPTPGAAVEAGTASIIPVSLQQPSQPLKTTRSMAPGGHEQSFPASFDQAERALIAALVMQGFVIDPVSSASGVIAAARWLQDPKDPHYSTRTQLSAEATANGSGQCIVQINAVESQVLHDESHTWRASPLLIPMPQSRFYKDVVKKSGPADAAFYRAIFELIDANLQGTAASSADRSRHFAAPVAQTLRAAVDALAQSGFTHLRPDEELHFINASRSQSKDSRKEGRTTHYVEATVFVMADADGSRLLLAANARDTWGAMNEAYNMLAAEQLQALRAQMGSDAYLYSSGGVTQEGEAEPALYRDVLALIEQKLSPPDAARR